MVGPKDPLISTMNMIQPGTGLIVAMAQSRPVMGSNAKKGQTYWNLAVGPGDGRHPGLPGGLDLQGCSRSAAALEKGIPLSKKFNARSPMDFSGARFTVLPRARARLRSAGSSELHGHNGSWT